MLTAQVSFSDEIAQLEMQEFHSGVAMAVVDVNGDQRDDIVRLQNGEDLYIEYQYADGVFRGELVDNITLDDPQWTLAVGDIDNNGRADIMVGERDQQHLWMAGDGTDFQNTYTVSEIVDGGFFSQGSNFVDINADGWLDAFHCNDDGESFIWANDGTGALVLANDWIDMQTGGPDFDLHSGNYGSVWTDFDSDGDIDLYIARCRLSVDDPTDPRRINGLYENDGQGNFLENAGAYGLDIGWQSWTAEFQDIDNDGDFDCFVTNHDFPSQLLENQDGTFVDVTSESGINVELIAIQAAMKDFDNDGFVDLIVSGTNGFGEYYHNNGDKTFTKMDGFVDDRELHSFVVGDVNRDGYLDFYGGYAVGYNEATDINDALWMNQGGDNNFLAVSLIGSDCNLDGIGARIEISGDFGQQLREVRAGESYGIVHSKTQHFGLGSHDMVASLEVTWPNGNTEVFDNIAANQFITIIENECIAPIVSLEVDGATTICDDETVTITASTHDGFSYEWSNGETGQSIEVNDSGIYTVRVTNDAGCYANSSAIEVLKNPDETPSIIASDLVACAGESVSMIASNYSNYEWSTGETSQEIMIDESGTYSVTIQGWCETFTSEEVTIEIKDPVVEPTVLTPDANITSANTAILEAEGTDIRWYESEESEWHIFAGPVFETPELTESTTYWVDNFEGAELEFGGKPDFEDGSVNGQQFNGYLIFDAYESFVLQTIDVRSESDGERTFQVFDSAFELIVEKNVFVESGDQTVFLGLDIPQGESLVFRCAEHPDMTRNNENVEYPYPIGTVGAITASNYDQPEDNEYYYYYYYNWQIQKGQAVCSSERIPVDVEVFLTGIEDNTGEISLYPNPAQDRLNISFSGAFDLQEVKLNSVDGKTLKSILLDSENTGKLVIDISDLSQGVYYVELSDGESRYNQKVVINR